MTDDVLLGCEKCRVVTPHVPAERVVGRLDKAQLDGGFRLKRMVEVEPTNTLKQANVVELLYMCVECGGLRRWGLEVVDDEAGSVRGEAEQSGEQGGEGDGAELGREHRG